MLKALELYGFKSFADRTRFDFPDGITVVVGPNGSGKSNIVDGIKWVLGSQSAKSLRGKEMADVIFKGASDRKPAGAAEASIFFDNSSGTLPYEAEEIQVTRRVYRSGESEYLINGSPCRLKDVKNLVRGSGIGIDAYSLIEQGKVDRMLQANPKDRRAIFEEAAGISRFKAKKVEAARRLARVQQNLNRLGDIVDEVGSRLDSLKSQASKAERYRQASERLKELRTQLAWTDWIALTNVLDTSSQKLDTANADLQSAQSRLEEAQGSRQALDLQLQDLAADATRFESQRNELSRRIAALSGTREADFQSIADMDRQLASSRRRLRLLRSQAGSAVAELRDLKRRAGEAQTELSEATETNNQAESFRKIANERLEEIRVRRDAVQSEHLEALRLAADLEGSLHRYQQRIDAGQRTLDSLAVRVEAAVAAVSEAQDEVRRCESRIAELDAAIEVESKSIDKHQAELGQQRRVLQRRRDESSALRVRLQGVSERANLLEDLSRRQEGIQTGVRKLLEAVEQTPTGPLADVLGIVGNLIESDVHVAPLIDVALGPLSQYLVVTGDRLQRAVISGELGLEGRVGLLRIDEIPSRRSGDRIRLDGLKGVVGRADRMVHVADEHAPLARHLLGTTWLVDTMQTALGLRRLSGAGLRFVTGGCELLERDGSVVLGPASAASGLVSRRSELAAARKDMQHYQFQLRENDQEIERLAAIVEQETADLGRLEQEHRQSVTLRASAGATKDAAIEREASRQALLADLLQQRSDQESLTEEAQQKLESVSVELRECQGKISALESESESIIERLAERQAELRAATEVVMRSSVELARIEQRAEALQATLEQQQRDQSQRDAAVAEVHEQIEQDLARRTKTETRILNFGSELTELHLQCESIESEMQELAKRVKHLKANIRDQQKQVDALQEESNRFSEQVRSIERERDDAVLRRNTLAQRVEEDYQLDLHAESPPEGFTPTEEREATEEEIARLRSQLQKTGAVNMEALEELQELQQRYDLLHGQYQDLTAARESLERIIQRINTDSRRLFLDTLEAIRANFQKLYRKSFGGGSADLILEADADPLEAGVEIVATPPGKPSFSNSLLSGGEKALTAVALLMAIFQYRPSPFCVLDEVDAPFDEANIGRFVTVLSEFLDHSKFVVVTHSKKTMTAANTLYGVTMQESGVSKQVSVRFEDVSEDGHIRNAA